jgi:hypothetical protein
MMRMKTLVLSVLVSLVALNQSLALTNISVNNQNEPVKKVDSSEVAEVKFEMTIDDVQDVLTVDLDGTFDKYSSVSVTNNRGSEYYFQFVNDGSNKLTFDLAKLEKGSYYLVLNTDKEIRIKRFVIN